MTDPEQRIRTYLRGYAGSLGESDLDEVLAAARADERKRTTAAVLAVRDEFRSRGDRLRLLETGESVAGMLDAALAQPVDTEVPS